MKIVEYCVFRDVNLLDLYVSENMYAPEDGENSEEVSNGIYDHEIRNGANQDDFLSPLLRLERYAMSDNVYDRQVVGRVALETLRAVADTPEDIRAAMDIINRAAFDTETTVRAELMEQLPHIAMVCHEERDRLYFVVQEYLLSLVIRLLGDSDNQVRKTTQAALLVLMEQGLVEIRDVEQLVCPVILTLTEVDNLVEFHTGAVALMSKMAPLLGGEATERLFMHRFAVLCADPVFYVRKVCANTFGDFCAVVGTEATEEFLLPCFVELCNDGIWGVRKACAEVFTTVALLCTLRTRKETLAPVFNNLLLDQSRWVRMSAFQSLGQFIATFVNTNSCNVFHNEHVGTVPHHEDLRFSAPSSGPNSNATIVTSGEEAASLLGSQPYHFSKGNLPVVHESNHNRLPNMSCYICCMQSARISNIGNMNTVPLLSATCCGTSEQTEKTEISNNIHVNSVHTSNVRPVNDSGDSNMSCLTGVETDSTSQNFNAFQYWRVPIPELELSNTIDEDNTLIILSRKKTNDVCMSSCPLLQANTKTSINQELDYLTSRLQQEFFMNSGEVDLSDLCHSRVLRHRENLCLENIQNTTIHFSETQRHHRQKDVGSISFGSQDKEDSMTSHDKPLKSYDEPTAFHNGSGIYQENSGVSKPYMLSEENISPNTSYEDSHTSNDKPSAVREGPGAAREGPGAAREGPSAAIEESASFREKTSPLLQCNTSLEEPSIKQEHSSTIHDEQSVVHERPNSECKEPNSVHKEPMSSEQDTFHNNPCVLHNEPTTHKGTGSYEDLAASQEFARQVQHKASCKDSIVVQEDLSVLQDKSSISDIKRNAPTNETTLRKKHNEYFLFGSKDKQSEHSHEESHCVPHHEQSSSPLNVKLHSSMFYQKQKPSSPFSDRRTSMSFLCQEQRSSAYQLQRSTPYQEQRTALYQQRPASYQEQRPLMLFQEQRHSNIYPPNISSLYFPDEEEDDTTSYPVVNSLIQSNVPSNRPLQDIVPHYLVEHFVSMTHPSQAQNTDNEITHHCAFSIPAVALTLGRNNWHLIKPAYEALASDVQWKVRRTVAASIHELAVILGEELAGSDLVPVFHGFIKDLDEVRIGALIHLADFLKLLRPTERSTLLHRLSDFNLTDNECNWRFRNELAGQLLHSITLFTPGDTHEHITPLAISLLMDKVAAVRKKALCLVTQLVHHVSSEINLVRNLLAELAEQFAHNKHWSRRQTFALLCSKLMGQHVLKDEHFASDVFPHLLDLSWDPVPNVRLSVARTLACDVAVQSYFVSSESPHNEVLIECLRRLQDDDDKDVRYFASLYSIPSSTSILELISGGDQ